MERPPRFFLRELKDIDPSFFVEIDRANGAYLICKMKKQVYQKPDGSLGWEEEKRILEDFEVLNDAALAYLRYRKWLGRNYKTAEGPARWQAYLEARKQETIERNRRRLAEYLAPEIESIYRSDERRTFS